MAVYTLEFRKVPDLYKSLTGNDFWESLNWPLPSFLESGSDDAKTWLSELQNKIFIHYKYNEICTGALPRFFDFFQDGDLLFRFSQAKARQGA